MQSAREAREARRRKILARGADRLAYITGQITAIPEGSPTAVAEVPTPNHRSGDAALISLVDLGALEPADAEVSSDCGNEFQPSSRILKDVREQLAALAIQDRDVTSEPDSVQQVDSPSSDTPSDTSIKKHIDVNTTRWVIRVGTGPSSLTWKGLRCSIKTTENLRASLASCLAFLVVCESFMSCNKDLQVHLSRWVPSWPGALIIIIDFTLVFCAVSCGLVKSISDDREERGGQRSKQEKFSQPSSVTSTMESLLQATFVSVESIQALFIDYSIYSVVLITGVSLCQVWGPGLCSRVSFYIKNLG